jgi:hypothetical protein
MQAVEKYPGVQAMDIGSGFLQADDSGMGFNRVAVLENGSNRKGSSGVQTTVWSWMLSMWIRECNERSCFAALRQ